MGEIKSLYSPESDSRKWTNRNLQMDEEIVADVEGFKEKGNHEILLYLVTKESIVLPRSALRILHCLKSDERIGIIRIGETVRVRRIDSRSDRIVEVE